MLVGFKEGILPGNSAIPGLTGIPIPLFATNINPKKLYQDRFYFFYHKEYTPFQSYLTKKYVLMFDGGTSTKSPWNSGASMQVVFVWV